MCILKTLVVEWHQLFHWEQQRMCDEAHIVTKPDNFAGGMEAVHLSRHGIILSICSTVWYEQQYCAYNHTVHGIWQGAHLVLADKSQHIAGAFAVLWSRNHCFQRLWCVMSPTRKAKIMHWKHQSLLHLEIKIEVPTNCGEECTVFAAVTDFLCWNWRSVTLP